VRTLFLDRDFTAYFVARQSSRLASGIEDVAIGWQIFALRHHPFDLGLVGLILFAPQLAFALPAGIIADRFDRRVVCVCAAIAEVAGLSAFVVLAASGTTSLPAYFLAIACIGTAHAFGSPAQRSILAGIVRSQHFVRASALSSSVGALVNIGGPAIAGALIAIRTPVAFGAAAFCYAIAAIGFALLRSRDVAFEDIPLLRAAREGIAFIFSRRVVLGAISLDLFAVLFGGATALLPVYATQILHVGPTGFGMLRSAPAVGAVIVAAIIARRPIVRHAGPLLLCCVLSFGVSTIVFGLSKNFVLSLVALACTGAFDMVSVVIRQALVQLGTPDALRGRVGAIEGAFIGASNELGAFESGTLAAFIGSVGSVAVGGAATIAVIALWAFFFPQLRRYDRLVPIDTQTG
jgi:MFS family permease